MACLSPSVVFFKPSYGSATSCDEDTMVDFRHLDNDLDSVNKSMRAPSSEL